MDKQKLETFIDKFNLAGTIEAVKIVSDGKTLKTTFMTPDKTLVGAVSAKDIVMDEGEYSIFSTAKFKGFLKVLTDEITITPEKNDTTPIGLTLTDTDKTEVNFVLSDPSVIPTPPKVKAIPTFDVEIPIDDAFVDRFIRAKNSLSEVDAFTLIPSKKGGIELVIGYSSVNTNRVKVPVTPTAGKDTLKEPVSFNANYFKSILAENREATGAVFKVVEAGISQISFSTPEFDSTYYLVKKTLES